MSQLSDLLLQILTQIGGGPAAPENNLVRFTLPAIFWAILLVVAWSRQRHGEYPRERLLLWGFGLAFFRELFMLAHLSEKLMNSDTHLAHNSYLEPLEHLLGIAAILVIAAAFLRYILDDEVLPRIYLSFGLAVVAAGFIATAYWWPRQVAINPSLRFNLTAPAWLLHGLELVMIAAAMIILIKYKGWLRNVVIIALSFLFLSQLLALINYMNGQLYSFVLCPVSNNLHIWAVPIFGFVYFQEQALEKRQADKALLDYRDHLQDLVDERTAELRQANKRLERAAVLEERQRIAAEMHDGLAQTLSTIGLKSSQAAVFLHVEDTERAMQEIDNMEEIISRAVCDVRRSIASLQQSPEPLLPLQEALQQLAAETTLGKEQLAFAFGAIEKPVMLDSREKEQVLRVAQEALLNATRHACAQQIMISLRNVSEDYQIEIEDDGIGFDPAAAAINPDNHFGLSIMRARASHINGKLTIKSSPGQGTSVLLSWPAGAAGQKEIWQAPASEMLEPA